MLLWLLPATSLRACCSRDISASIAAINSDVFIGVAVYVNVADYFALLPPVMSHLYSSSRLSLGMRDAPLDEITNALGSGFEEPVHPVTEEHAQEERNRSQQQVVRSFGQRCPRSHRTFNSERNGECVRYNVKRNLQDKNGERAIDGGFWRGRSDRCPEQRNSADRIDVNWKRTTAIL